MTGTAALARGAISIEHLWKRFRMDRSRPIFRDEVGRIGDILRRRQDRSRWRWALRDLELQIEPGESIGLFGANGSGKSTLLKILTRVMYPTAGRLDIAGRVGALIEIKAGIHPDLTGRENIYLYGSIMGLSRSDVRRRFDGIVDFAELSDALDRQLKYYSSGMAMRLGFAVAAFLEPDVLLVDEVLAVGDATFQQKCLDRMRVVLEEGTTLVFVSHDLASVESIAKRGIWLRDGVVAADGPIRESLRSYRQHIESRAELTAFGQGDIGAAVRVFSPEGSVPLSGGPMNIDVTLMTATSRHAVLYAGVSEGSAAPIFSVHHEVRLEEGANQILCKIPSVPLPRGRYFVWLAVTDPTGSDLVPWHPATELEVQGPELEPMLPGIMRPSPVHVLTEWESSEHGSASFTRSAHDG